LRSHFKNCYETARATRGMNLHKALHYMEKVLAHESVIPFRRFNDGVSRKAMSK
jgi:large subunit ribosomal protein L17e